MVEAISHEINTLSKEAEEKIQKAQSFAELNDLKVEYLGKKGKITLLMQYLGKASPEKRPELGKLINDIKELVSGILEKKISEVKQIELDSKLQNEKIDITLPSMVPDLGKKHPLYKTLEEIENIFVSMGFSVAEGPNIEMDEYNFTALNILPNHPARDMHDTFYITNNLLLRTHTSPVQIRTMKTHKPPLAIIAPGRVYRSDTPDASHSPVFHQVEGLLVDKKVTFGNLKAVLDMFVQEMFGKDLKTQFRPSYFPFTEPSAEVDMECVICRGKGCRLCKQSGWLEILGCGMVNSPVFENVGYNPREVSGFAFGMGVERITMLKYGIHDIRLFFENDIRFLSQF